MMTENMRKYGASKFLFGAPRGLTEAKGVLANAEQSDDYFMTLGIHPKHADLVLDRKDEFTNREVVEHFKVFLKANET